MLIVIGTSSVVYPAAGFIPRVKARGGTVVVEINPEATANSRMCDITFSAKAGELIPTLFAAQEPLSS